MPVAARKAVFEDKIIVGNRHDVIYFADEIFSAVIGQCVGKVAVVPSAVAELPIEHAVIFGVVGIVSVTRFAACPVAVSQRRAVNPSPCTFLRRVA